MSALLKQYFNIAFLMGKPQDLPAGESQLYVGVALNFVTYIIAITVIYGADNAILHALIDISISGLFLYIALKLTDKLERFQQSFGALSGAGAVLNLSAVLMLYPSVSGSGGGLFGELPHFVLLVWSLSLAAHVVRHTFDIRMVASIGVALVYYIFIMNVMAAVMPAPAAQDNAVNENVSFVLPELRPPLQLALFPV